MRTTNDKAMAEEATGCREHGVLQMFHRLDPSFPLTPQKAMDLFEQGEEIEVPAAGAGSWREVLEMLNHREATLADTTSSAGDWTIRLDDEPNMFVTQRNRYPRHGFGYRRYEDWLVWEKGGGDTQPDPYRMGFEITHAEEKPGGVVGIVLPDDPEKRRHILDIMTRKEDVINPTNEHLF